MTLKITDTGDDFDKIKHQLSFLQHHQVAVGFWGGHDPKLLTIVAANEFGATIRPKNGDWLTIPSVNDPYGKDGARMSVSEYKQAHQDKEHELFRPGGKDGAHLLAVKDATSPYGFKIIFYLVKKVTIPARPFIRRAYLVNQRKYQRIAEKGLARIMDGEMTGAELLNHLGIVAAGDIRRAGIRLRHPKNAPVTIENKGNDNPLTEHAGAGMLQKVTWQIVPA